MTQTAVHQDTTTPPDRAPVQLLWTGGWDSSFRLMQLLLVEQRSVQPIYVIDTGRDTTLIELRTMQRMREGLLARLADPSLLAPTQIIAAHEHPPSPELVAMRERIRQQAKIGTQYAWLAGVAESLGWEGVEICMQAHDGGPSSLHRVVFADEHGTLSDAPEAQLFRFWRFPVLHITKGEMARIAREHGFYDLLVQRWFCFTPVGGKPCGRCVPCSRANPDGVDFANPLAVTVAHRWGGLRRRLRRLRSAS